VADLLTQETLTAVPLAERMRPRTIADVVGQRHLLAPGKPLAVAFAAGQPHSMILWGPPGVGKTTLARLMADAFSADFIAISAVLAGVKDIRDAVARAEATRAPIRPRDDPVRRRSPSLQQGAAGCVSAFRRAGPPHVHRRDDREPVVRGERRVVVARGGLRAGAAVTGGSRRAARPRDCAVAARNGAWMGLRATP
jgi:hypothetical protein